MTGPIVRLTRAEMYFAAIGGAMRNVDALLAGRRTIFGNPQRELWTNNMIGALGELAANKYLDRYWTPLYDDPTGVPDAGTGTQVRSSISRGGLAVYERDADDHVFIFVWVQAPRCELVGWTRGSEAKTDRYSQNGYREATWRVPCEHLHPVEWLALPAADATLDPAELFA